MSSLWVLMVTVGLQPGPGHSIAGPQMEALAKQNALEQKRITNIGSSGKCALCACETVGQNGSLQTVDLGTSMWRIYMRLRIIHLRIRMFFTERDIRELERLTKDESEKRREREMWSIPVYSK
jgi:hypothetical protein